MSNPKTTVTGMLSAGATVAQAIAVAHQPELDVLSGGHGMKVVAGLAIFSTLLNALGLIFAKDATISNTGDGQAAKS